MTKRNYYTEKSIAVFQIIFNSIFLITSIYGVYIIYDFAIKNLRPLPNNFSLTKMVLSNQSSIVLSVVAITGGLLLLLQRKSGWVLTLATSIVTGWFSLINFFKLYFSSADTATSTKKVLIVNFIIFLIFTLISFLLISKPFKLKYKPTKQTGWITFMVIALLIAEKVLFQIMK
jgi:hypothetical protein